MCILQFSFLSFYKYKSIKHEIWELYKFSLNVMCVDIQSFKNKNIWNSVSWKYTNVNIFEESDFFCKALTIS